MRRWGMKRKEGGRRVTMHYWHMLDALSAMPAMKSKQLTAELLGACVIIN